MGRQSKFPAEMRERAVRLVFEQQEHHESQWATIVSVASKMGCTPETLRKWVRQMERDEGQRPGLTTSERERMKELEREVRELKRANEILHKASVHSTGQGNAPAKVSSGVLYPSVLRGLVFSWCAVLFSCAWV